MLIEVFTMNIIVCSALFLPRICCQKVHVTLETTMHEHNAGRNRRAYFPKFRQYDVGMVRTSLKPVKLEGTKYPELSIT
jgi:hypothetical protein